jgi:hypothetical protein
MVGNDRIQAKNVARLQILVMMVLPSLEEVESFALPVQSTKNPSEEACSRTR